MVSETSKSKNVVPYLDLQLDISIGDLVVQFLTRRIYLIFILSIFLIYIGIFQQPQLIVQGVPEKVLPFNKESNNSLLLYCLKIFRF